MPGSADRAALSAAAGVATVALTLIAPACSRKLPLVEGAIVSSATSALIAGATVVAARLMPAPVRAVLTGVTSTLPLA
eukprot:17232-Heterococcus_DN1.PRE.1